MGPHWVLRQLAVEESWHVLCNTGRGFDDNPEIRNTWMSLSQRLVALVYSIAEDVVFPDEEQTENVRATAEEVLIKEIPEFEHWMAAIVVSELVDYGEKQGGAHENKC